ncbi:MAG: UDP-N-acetylmuramoyl-L-alanine--D-glutamate ligase [Pseudomonadota bacterium]
MYAHSDKKMHYVVVGLGLTGFSCARFLARQGYAFSVVDTRPIVAQAAAFRAEFPNVTLSLGDIEPTLAKADVLVVSPGVPLTDPALQSCRARGVPMTGDIELFVQHTDVPIVAITGTNGKSTVTTLVADLLNAAGCYAVPGGNLGIPALDLLLEAASSQQKPDYFVLELSSYQLERTFSLKAAVAAILNVAPDHQDRHPTFKEYQSMKHRIYEGAAALVYKRSDPTTHPSACTPAQQCITFDTDSVAHGVGIQVQKGEGFIALDNNPLFSLSHLKIPGLVFQDNVLSAMAIVSALLPMTTETIARMVLAIEGFQGLPHRCAMVGQCGGVYYVNDSKGTNVSATVAALISMQNTYAGNIFLLAGGDGKQADFSPLRSAINAQVGCLLLYGRDANILGAALLGAAPIRFAPTLIEAMDIARGIAQPGDVVLLSPACASWDQFKDYQERGQVFIQQVQRYQAACAADTTAAALV